MIIPVRLLMAIILIFGIYLGTVHAQVTDTTAIVQYSASGGFYSAPVSVELSCATPGAEIRYTLNGAEPDAQSALYSNTPFMFDTTSILRTRAVSAGMSPSPVVTQSYIVGANHSFPVVSLTFEPAAFFDSLSGIYPNYDQELSAVANIELFDAGAAVINQKVEVEIQGTGSASQPQKSLEIKAKKSLGAEEINYPLFSDLPFETYKRFVLRNGGQDWCVMQFRDEFATSLMFDRSDIGGILKTPKLYLQAWRPAVVYLNGRYWGIHNMRERMNRFYVRQHFGWAQDSFDLIENYGEVSSGDSVAWFQFFNYLWQTPSGFDDDAQFDNIKQKIDYQNYVDYCAFNIYLENEDWPGNNVLRFRHRSDGDDGKWRWASYDLDFTFGLYQAGGGWNTGDPSPNALARLLEDSSQVWPNPDWATLLFRRCWQNATFRQDFANRLADMLNTAFLPQRVCARLDTMRALYQPEITRHYIRWWFGNYDAVWLQNIEKTRNFAQNRPGFVQNEILQAVTEAEGLVELTVNVAPPGGGRVEVSTVQPQDDQFPWAGVYFKGIPVPLKAVANPGYKFIGWSKPELGAADSTRLLITDSSLLVAHFQLIDTGSTTGVAGSPGIPLTIFPNPAHKQVTVCGLSSDVHMQVFNGLGQAVIQALVAGPDPAGCATLTLPKLPAGLYFLKITGTQSPSTLHQFLISSF